MDIFPEIVRVGVDVDDVVSLGKRIVRGGDFTEPHAYREHRVNVLEYLLCSFRPLRAITPTDRERV